MTNIVVCTGAGISAESGVSTFHDPDNMWLKNDSTKWLSVWQNDPQSFLDIVNTLHRELSAGNHKPNAAHLALTRLQREWSHGEVTIITQNLDGLHQQAGSRVYEMYGNMSEKMCDYCLQRTPYHADIILMEPCRGCGRMGSTRPFHSLYGEKTAVFWQDLFEHKFDECSIFAVIGSSCKMLDDSPHRFLGYRHRANKAKTYFLNKEPLCVDNQFHHAIYGLATKMVPKWVDMLLIGSATGH